jgi:hypothetical protein
MIEIRLDDQNALSARINEWDGRAFGFPVSEITSLRATRPELLRRLDEKNRELGVGLCVHRADAGDRRAKDALLTAGFSIVETSLRLGLDLMKLETRAAFAVSPADERAASRFEEIAAAFRHSRYHEDPGIAPEAAKRRIVGWLHDLLLRRELYALGPAEDPAGLFAYGRAGDRVDLLLVGTSPAQSGLGYFAFGSIFDHLKRAGAARVSARVSAANIPMINVYAAFGALAESAAFDFHKRYEKEL